MVDENIGYKSEITLPNQPDDQFNFELNDLISCFKAIDFLFRSEIEIILTENNLSIFENISHIS
jgi:hypothetical protein